MFNGLKDWLDLNGNSLLRIANFIFTIPWSNCSWGNIIFKLIFKTHFFFFTTDLRDDLRWDDIIPIVRLPTRCLLPSSEEGMYQVYPDDCCLQAQLTLLDTHQLKRDYVSSLTRRLLQTLWTATSCMKRDYCIKFSQIRWLFATMFSEVTVQLTLLDCHRLKRDYVKSIQWVPAKL